MLARTVVVEVRPGDGDLETLAKTATLLREVFPKASCFDTAYLDWTYNANPNGLVVAVNAWDGDEVIAHFSGTPMPVRLNGVEERGLLVQHLATSPRFRRRGLLKVLGEEMLDAGRARGFAFAMGVANAQSTDRVIKDLGFQRVGSLDAKLGLGAVPPSSWTAEPGFVRVWDEDSIRWRLANPARRYGVKLTTDGQAILHGSVGRSGVTIELGAVDARLVPADVPALTSWNPLRLWLGIDSQRDWSGRCFFDIPERLRPSPLNFLFRDLTDRKLAPRREQVKFTCLDFDAY